LVVVGLLMLVGLAAGVTALYVAGRPDASLQVQAYTVLSDQKVTATVEVTKPAGRSAACEVRALDQALNLVGTVRVEATGRAKNVRLEVLLPTTTRAFGVRAGDCVLE
jgi:hypothetical protein